MVMSWAKDDNGKIVVVPEFSSNVIFAVVAVGVTVAFVASGRGLKNKILASAIVITFVMHAVQRNKSGIIPRSKRGIAFLPLLKRRYLHGLYLAQRFLSRSPVIIIVRGLAL